MGTSIVFLQTNLGKADLFFGFIFRWKTNLRRMKGASSKLFSIPTALQPSKLSTISQCWTCISKATKPRPLQAIPSHMTIRRSDTLCSISHNTIGCNSGVIVYEHGVPKRASIHIEQSDCGPRCNLSVW